MTDVLVTPAFVSLVPDTGEASKFGPFAWNAARLFSGGNAGDQIVRDLASTTGASWIAPTTKASLGLGNVENTALSTWAGSTALTQLGANVSVRPNGLLINNPDGPGLVIKYGSTSNTRAPLIFVNPSGVVESYVGAGGNWVTCKWITISGASAQAGTIDAAGNFSVDPVVNAGSGVSSMLDVIGDTIAGIVVRASSTAGAYALIAQSHLSNFVFSIEDNGDLMWGAGATKAAMDTVLHRESTDALAMVRGVNQQTFRIYGTTTGPKYLQLQHDGTNASIGGASLGGSLTFGTLLSWSIRGTGELTAGIDNTYDIGRVGAVRPRNIYVAGSVVNRTKAGTPVDADVNTPTDGMLIVDTVGSKIWVRVGAAWKGVAVA